MGIQLFKHRCVVKSLYYTLVTLSSKLGVKPGAKNSLILIAILLTYCVTNTSVRNGLRPLS